VRQKLIWERYSSKEDTKSGGIKKHNTAYSGVKHDHMKAAQKMTGDQLLESGSKYEMAKIAQLPKELYDKAKVRNLLSGEALSKTKSFWSKGNKDPI
jgi:uncharacterized protein YcnI